MNRPSQRLTGEEHLSLLYGYGAAVHERIEGRGQLENWDRPDKKVSVGYRFDITTETLERPGFPRVATKKHSTGSILTASGESLPPGYYRLYAEDGEILKVQNVGLGLWTILAPVA